MCVFFFSSGVFVPWGGGGGATQELSEYVEVMRGSWGVLIRGYIPEILRP